MLNRPAELYPQLDALDQTIFKSFKKFGNRYCDPTMGQFGMQYTGAANLIELHWILHQTVMLRRLKTDVHDLPPKKRNKVTN